MKTSDKKGYFFLYSLCFSMIAIMVIFFIVLAGKTFVYINDPFDQDYPIFLYLGKCLREFLGGKGLKLYDFSIGLGENVIAPLNLYGFGDPLNLLSVFSTVSNARYLYAFLLLFRMYLAGAGMICYLKKHGFIRELAVGGALMYAFSLFAIVRGFYFYSLLNAMYIFPFLLMMLEELVRDKAGFDWGGVLFALLTALQACCSFYFLYMQTIFLVFYALVDYGRLYGKRFSLKHFFHFFSRTAGYYFLGISISGMVLFPTLHEFINSSRTVSQAVHGWQLLFGVKEIAVRFSNLFIPMWKYDNYGLAVSFLCVIGLIACLTAKYRKTKIQVFVACTAAAYFCPAFWRVTNGFSYVSDRWTYIVYFVVIYAGVTVLQDYLTEGISGQVLGAAIAIAIGSIGFHLLRNNDKIRSGAYLVAALGMAWFLARGKRSPGKVFFLILGSVCMEVFFLFASWRVCGHELVNNFCSKEEVQALTERILAEEGGEGRVERKEASKADSLLAGYAGTTEYFSILNKNTYRFWEKLLISPGIHAQVHHLEGVDGRAVPAALLDVVQYQDKEEMSENPYALAMGVSYADSISSQEFEKLSPLERQAMLLERIVLEEGDGRAAELRENKILEIPVKCAWENIEAKGERMVPGENARIVITPQEDVRAGKDGELYIFLSDFQCFVDNYVIINVGNKSMKVENRKSTYFTGLKDYLVNVQQEEDGTVLVEFPSWNEYQLGEIHLYWYSYEGMEAAVKELRNDSMKNVSVSNGKVSGEIEVSKDSWVFFPIPYSSDWRAEINGKKAELLQANVGFMALALVPGKYEIVLEYFPVCFWAGVCSTVVGSIVLVILWRKTHFVRKGSRVAST